MCIRDSNIYVSSKNHGFDPYDYVNNIPHHRVGPVSYTHLHGFLCSMSRYFAAAGASADETVIT